MKVLVTGGAGFIGSHIVEYFSDKADVVVLDHLRTGNVNKISNFNSEFVKGSVLDRELVKKCMRNVDYVFHLAAMVSVPESMKNPVECVDINTKGILVVLEEAAKAGVKKLCFSSTSAIYGDEPTFPKLETMNPCPKSPYAVSKLDGEYYCNIFNTNGWLKTACMRYFNVFGPRQDPDSAYAAAIPIFTNSAVNNQDLNIYGDGEQTRDFVYVKDVVRTNVYLAESDFSGVYNVGYGERTTINRIAQKIIDVVGSKSGIVYKPERPGDVKHSVSSIDKLLKTGYDLKNNFEKGMTETIKFFQQHNLG